MKRLHQAVLIATFVPCCWLGMMAIHELGHVAAGWATGGTVTRVVLHPLKISRTDVSPNPRPGVVVWLGPIVGVVAPVIVWAILAWAKIPGDFLARFFAGFCLVTNGAYIGVGSFGKIGDAGVMLRHGSPIWSLWMFGAVAIASGLMLWHRQGKHFGLGESRGEVEPWTAYLSLLLLILTLVAEFVFFPVSPT